METTGPQNKARRTPGGVVIVCVAFLMVNAVVVAVCVWGGLSVEGYRSLAEIENTYRFVMAGELFFIMFLWPFLGARRGAVSVPVLAALIVISVPLVLVAAWVADVPVYTVLLTHLLLLSVSAAVVSVCRLVGRKGVSYWRYYYLAAVAIAGGVPLVQFLLLDLTGKGLRWLSCIAPFWAMELAQQTSPDASRLLWTVSVLFFAAIATAAQRV